MQYEGLEFEETCAGCPEQYDVYKDGTLVGYVRLRWGYLSCECPDVGGEQVYDHSFSDEWKGVMTPSEREAYLPECARAINEYLVDIDADWDD